jgi:hypothetical protein
MNSSGEDPVSRELRAVEREVDNCYQTNALTGIPFASAAWHFLAYCEDVAFRRMLQGDNANLYDYGVFAEGLATHLKYPMLWLRSRCPSGGTTRPEFNPSMYGASHELSLLGEAYIVFETAFTYASRNLVQLRLDNNTVRASQGVLSDARVEAYDYLVKVPRTMPDGPKGSVLDLVEPFVRVQDDSFSYQLTPRMVAAVSQLLQPLWEEYFRLPDSWQFVYCSLGELRRVWQALESIVFIHIAARATAAVRGCLRAGYLNGLLLMSPDELLARLRRYSGVDEPIVQRIIDYLTYGAVGVRKPDPAIQPLVKLSESHYLIMPHLILASSPERNFTVLLNKLPAERDAYSRLVQSKENLMKSRIALAIAKLSLRTFTGHVPNTGTMPDIDLALIDDVGKACLLLELKWFIAPDEVGEVIEKSEEIEKGIAQQLDLKQAVLTNPRPFHQALCIDSSYRVEFAVVSENSIGLPSIQLPEVPVVQENHLVRTLVHRAHLAPILDWLAGRDFLPTSGVHFEAVEEESQVGEWRVRWPCVRILAKEPYQ